MRRSSAVALLAIAAALVYANSFNGAFVFDDHPAIVENPHVRTLLPLSQSLTSPPEVTTAGRPLAALSFAVNYAQGGYDTWWFHATNLAIHAAAALALFGIVRRTLLAPPLAPRFGSGATQLAFTIALLWVVHPLQTQAVTYIVQRVESLMGLLLLLTVYCAIRGRGWELAALLCCALGMATKQTMAGAPLLVLLWDYVFARRLRWRFYAGLASTWLLLVWLVSRDMRPHSVGAIEGWTPVRYLVTQAGVILHYLRLAVIPSPLVFDYDWSPAHGVGMALAVAVVASLAAVTVAGLVRQQPWAFAGAWFLVILAPTSSVLPIVTEVAAEHRMYLPLAAVLTVLVLGLYGVAAWLRRPHLTLAVCALVTPLLAMQTIVRNRAYESDERIWSVTIEQQPANARAHNNYAVDLLRAGRMADAETHARQAVALNPALAEAHRTLGVVRLALGRADEGIADLERARQLDPADGKTYQNLGEAYGAKGDLRAALASFLRAATYLPDDPFVLNRAGWILATAGDPGLRDGRRALALARHAVDVTHREDGESLDTLAAACAELGDFDNAVATARESVRVAQAQGQTAMVPELEQRLSSYLARQPFRSR